MSTKRIFGSSYKFFTQSRVLLRRRWISSPCLDVCYRDSTLTRLAFVASAGCQLRFCQSETSSLTIKSDDSLGAIDSQYNTRYFLLGKSVVERILVEMLLKERPDTAIGELIATVDSLIYMISRKTDGDQSEDFKVKMQHFGRLYQDHSRVEDLLELLEETFGARLKGQDYSLCLKLFYPKYYILKILSADVQNVHIQSAVAESKKQGVSVKLSVEGNVVATAEGINFNTAEKDACRNYILDNFKDKLKDIDLPDEDAIALEEDVHFRDSPKQRRVQLHKDDGQNYGFYVRGGDQQEASNVKYRKLFYYSPVYVSKIDPGSPAHASGKMEVGDVILAVNDYNVKGLGHNSVVKLIRKSPKSVFLTLVSNPDVYMKDYLRERNRERQIEKIKSDASREKWREWHLAQAEKNPQKYIKFIQELERHQSNS